MHGTRSPHSVCSPIYENALSPGSWEAPACWSILLCCEGLVCEKRRCVRIWTLVTAGWQHTGLLTSGHIVHGAVVVEIFPELITSTADNSNWSAFISRYNLMTFLYLIDERGVLLQGETASGEWMPHRAESISMFFMRAGSHIPLVRCWWFDGRELTQTMCKQSVSLQLS